MPILELLPYIVSGLHFQHIFITTVETDTRPILLLIAYFTILQKKQNKKDLPSLK